MADNYPRNRGRQHDGDQIPNHGDVFSTLPQPIVVTYLTDHPLLQPAANGPTLTEEQKQAAAEAASAQIEQWQRQWDTGVVGYDLTPPPPDPDAPFTPMPNLIERARQNALDAVNALQWQYGDIPLRFGFEPEATPEIRMTADTRAFAHTIAVATLKAYRLRKPYLLGIDLGCACHPWPNPAGRDYRRRTKHRNRRRKP